MSVAVVKSWVACIVIFGHLLVFIFGIALGIFSLLSGIDAIQTILIACPVLSTTAFAAFGHVMSEMDEVPHKRTNRNVSKLFTTIVLVFPTALLLAILSLFFLFWTQLDGFGPEQLKIALGALETFLAFIWELSQRSYLDLKALKIHIASRNVSHKKCLLACVIRAVSIVMLSMRKHR